MFVGSLIVTNLTKFKQCIRIFKCQSLHYTVLPESVPELDFDYLCDIKNRKEIETNIIRRKSNADINHVSSLYSILEGHESKRETHLKDLIKAALNVPNKTHPDILNFDQEPVLVKYVGSEKVFPHKPQTFDDIAEKLRLIQMKHMSTVTGHRTYFLIDELSLLEDAIIQYSVLKLLEKGFDLISVPDILNEEDIENCGFNTRGDRNQVYRLDERFGRGLCLSGTAEMGIASFLKNKMFHSSQLPLRFASVSRCYRAETSKVSEERGLYRVHQFTKLEMFSVTSPRDSHQILEEFLQIQENILKDLGLYLRVMDMPQEELGNPAYRKFDIECWMPGREMWGELTSASNCTDYQSRRLNIRTENGFPHTINGTACAPPRLIIALVETHQNQNNTITVPEVLVDHTGFDIIRKSRVPKFSLWKVFNDEIS